MRVAKSKQHDNAGMFISQVIEVFEDFLEERDIDIPNDEKVESDDPSVIYGTDFGELQSELEGLFMAWGVLELEDTDRN